jgi:hypothetical protein
MKPHTLRRSPLRILRLFAPTLQDVHEVPCYNRQSMAERTPGELHNGLFEGN